MRSRGIAIARGSITESAAGTFTQEEISLGLSSKEGIRVGNVVIDFLSADAGAKVVQLSKESKTGMVSPDDPDLLYKIATTSTIRLINQMPIGQRGENVFLESENLDSHLYIGILGPGTNPMTVYYRITYEIFSLTDAESVALLLS